MTQREILYLFIDASNSWEVQKAKGHFFDYQKIVAHLKTQFNVDDIEVFYYTAYPKEGTRNFELKSKHNFFVYLEKGLNFKVRKKELKRIRMKDEKGEFITDKEGKVIIKEKGDMDVEIVIDALDSLNKYDTAVFFTGDSDFLSLVSYLRNRGKKIYVFSSGNNISNELRTGADGYFDCLKIDADIWGKGIEYRKV